MLLYVFFHEILMSQIELFTDKAVRCEIPVKLVKGFNFSFHALTNCVNESIENKTFRDGSKEDKFILVYKSKNPLDKANYRPVSILSFLSKVYGKLLFNHLSNETTNFLSQILCGFRKAHRIQHTCFRLL